jgi:hypothetical protein
MTLIKAFSAGLSRMQHWVDWLTSFIRPRVLTDTDQQSAVLQKRKLELETRKVELENAKLAIEAENLRTTSGRLALVPIWSSLTALFVSLGSIALTAFTAFVQLQKTNDDKRLEQDKFFRETLEKATDQQAPVYRRVAFIWTLNSFWKTTHFEELSNAFGSMLINDTHREIISACADSLGHASEHFLDHSEQEKFRKVLFGTPISKGGSNGDRGVIGWALDIVGDSPPQEDVSGGAIWQMKRNKIIDVILKNQGHLQDCDFSVVTLPNLFWRDGADFSGSDFSNARLISWHAEAPVFSGCRLVGAKLQDSSLRRAKFLNSDLQSTSFLGSDISGAEFNGANLRGTNLSGANLKDTKGLPKDVMDQAVKSGAVLMNSADFARWKEFSYLPLDAGENYRWQRDGFKVDQMGQPVFADGSHPEHGLIRVKQ